MKYRKEYPLLILMLICFKCFSQQNEIKYPEIGKPIPDFKLDNVTHYSKNEVTNKDFKGKWLFLDFWFTGCTSCIRSFPKINELQKEFKGRAQFLLVGYNKESYVTNIEEVYEKLRIKQRLEMASAYDSILAKQWGVRSMPHIVIADPDGIVRFITDGRDMTKEKVAMLLNQEPVEFASKVEEVHPKFEGVLVDSDGKQIQRENVIGHSIITKWNGEETSGGIQIEEYVSYPESELRKGYKFVGVSLEWLYTSAYFGKPTGLLNFWGDPSYGNVFPNPILKIADTVSFRSNNNQKALYNYLLVLPPVHVTLENVMTYMQQDLERAFGYKAVIEERQMPIWKLVAKPGTEEKIKTKGGPEYYDAKHGKKSTVAGFTVRNVPMENYMMYLCFYLDERYRHPFINETGIESNIDLTIEADLTDINDLKKAIQKVGLDLVQDTKKMKVLVIKDPNPAKSQ